MMEMSAEATVAVMENILKHSKLNIPTRNAMENAVRLLKDQPEIVRCKDCKRLEYKGMAKVCPWIDVMVNENWFCADGEKKADTQNE